MVKQDLNQTVIARKGQHPKGKQSKSDSNLDPVKVTKQPKPTSTVKKGGARNLKMEQRARSTAPPTKKQVSKAAKTEQAEKFGSVEVGASNSEILSLAQYHRFDQTAFYIKGQRFSLDTSPTRKSTAYYWIMPGQTFDVQAHRGNLLRLHSTRVSIRNTSPFDVTLFAARPYGFESDPLAYSNWESLWKEGALVVKHGKTRTVTIRHHANNYVVPKQEYIGGKLCLHLFSMSASVNPLSPIGVPEDKIPDTSKTEYLRVTMHTKYTSDGSLTGPVKAYTIRHFETDSHMHVFNQPPPVAITVNQIRLPQTQANLVDWEDVNYLAANIGINADKEIGLVLAKFQGRDDPKGVPETSYESDSLDKRLIYQLSSGSPCITTNFCGSAKIGIGFARYVVYLEKGQTIIGDGQKEGVPDQPCKKSGWYLTIDADAQKAGTFQCLARFYNGNTSGLYAEYHLCTPIDDAGSTRWTPVIRNSAPPVTFKVSPTRPIDCDVNLLRSSATYRKTQLLDETELLGSWVDVLLSSVTMVVGLAKAVVEIAAVFGITEENNRADEGFELVG